LDAVSWTVIVLLFVPLALFTYVFGGWLLVVFGVVFPWHVGNLCVTDMSVKAENVGGFDFEFEEVNCDVIGSNDVRMIFVSRHGQSQRHRLAAYIDNGNEPRATLVAAQTVRLSLGSVAGFYIRDDRWRDLRVIYDYSPRKRYTVTQP
jgi:hypothetical protein